MYSPSKAPTCANPACTTINLGTGDPLNGIVVAGRNSPFGDAIYKFDKSNVQPRIGVTWDPASNGKTIYRTSYGVYFDQALVGIFEQNAFTNPPFVNTVSILNARLSNPGSGTTNTTSGVFNLIGNGDDFKTPRTQQWNAGVQRQIYARGAIDVSYVGTHGDRLIRPIDINYPQPADVLRLGSVNLARPYQGYGSITLRETTGWVETIEAGANRLVGASAPKVRAAVRALGRGGKMGSAARAYGGGRAAEKIATTLARWLAARQAYG